MWGDTMDLQIIGQALAKEIEAWMPQALTEGRVSYYVGRLDEEAPMETIAARHEHMVHAGASIVKTLVMEYLFHLAQEGQLDLEDSLSIHRVPPVEGGGAIQELVGNHAFTYLELCRLMMVLSDNWATNLLLQALGVEEINGRAEELGLEVFQIQRFMMDSRARKEGRENRITAYEVAKLYDHLYHLKDHSAYGKEMWRILGRQQFRDHIPFHWGEDVPFYHKTGCLERVEHDGGVYMSLHGDYVLVILISDVDNDVAIDGSAQLGHMMREFLDDRLPQVY